MLLDLEYLAFRKVSIDAILVLILFLVLANQPLDLILFADDAGGFFKEFSKSSSS